MLSRVFARCVLVAQTSPSLHVQLVVPSLSCLCVGLSMNRHVSWWRWRWWKWTQVGYWWRQQVTVRDDVTWLAIVDCDCVDRALTDLVRPLRAQFDGRCVTESATLKLTPRGTWHDFTMMSSTTSRLLAWLLQQSTRVSVLIWIDSCTCNYAV